jgi:hypothetical protein
MSFQESAQSCAHRHCRYSTHNHQNTVRFQSTCDQPPARSEYNHCSHCTPESHLAFPRGTKALRLAYINQRKNPGAQDHQPYF